MSHETGCSFCESLRPAHPGWGSKPSKCPVCKQNLWVAQDRTTYRLSDEPLPGVGWRWAIGLSAVACLCVGIGVTWLAIAGKSTEVIQANREPQVQSRPIRVTEKPTDASVAVIAQPIVQAKAGATAMSARAKPLLSKAAKTPVPVRVAQAPVEIPMPVSKGSGNPMPSWRSINGFPDALVMELRSIPEVDLDPGYLQRSKNEIAAKAKEIVDATKKDKDAFVRKRMKDGGELGGLPYLLGKDCTMTKAQSEQLAIHSTFIRASLAMAERQVSRYPSGSYQETVKDTSPARFWSAIELHYKSGKPSVRVGIPALHQILLVENKEYRLSLLERLKDNKDARATELVVNRAVFDIDPDVRRAALESLRNRPKAEYRAALEKGLRYPWRPAVRHATEAVVALDLKEMIPHLLDLLKDTDPEAPHVVKGEDGRKKTVVRELVRINHHRNCMLCHAPMDVAGNANIRIARDLPVGPTPYGQEPLPPRSSSVYYSPRNGVTLVRADITYLRQDFSLLQHVENSGKWSNIQRFDFLVRTRELTAKQAAAYPALVRDYRYLIGEALTGLTGRCPPPTAQAWRAALAEPQPGVEARAK